MSCSRTQFKKGQIPWNKGIKKSIPINKTSFKKGMIPWNKGLTKEKDSRIMFYSLRMKIDNPIFKINQKKEKNYNWRGGLSFEPYPKEWSLIYRERVRKRDNYTCQLCKNKNFKRKLSIHHIDYNKKNIFHLNLISLCTKCHGDTGNDRNFWEIYFLLLMNKKRETFRRNYETV
jgi:hypothetical protein